MKRFKWLLVGLMVLCLAIIPLAGCVSKSEYEALQAEHAALQGENASLVKGNTSLRAELDEAQSDLTKLQADHDKLNNDYKTIETELAEIKEVCPLGDFASLNELREWADLHVVPCPLGTADEWYRAALKVQKEGMDDGYMVSAVITADPKDPERYLAWCTAFVGGDLYWWYPDKGEVYLLFDKYWLGL